MKLKRCPFGHYYDPSKYDGCPHCDDRDAYVPEDVTMALYDDEPGQQYAAAPSPQASDFPLQDDEQRTVAMYGGDVAAALVPPVGYLVCVLGAARGQDFRLHTQRNTIGRASSNDVCIKGDLGISREMNAVISYNPRARHFHLMAGEGKSIVYLNGEEVMQPVQLKHKDRIEIGDTMLVFFPVCGADFDWDGLEQE